MKIQNVKGGYDYLPNKQNIRDYINDILKETFKEYGYLSVETPILSYYDILSGKYDENNDILNEIYKLNDQGNRKLGLRYDLTVPFAKLIALNKNEIKFPFKRYEINKVFRDGAVKVGRDREFTQCDVDVVGLDGELIEAELLSLYVSAFRKLNIDIVIKYNNRKLMNGLILDCGIEEELLSKTITILDKIEKVSKEDLTNMLIEIGIDYNKIDNLYNIFKLSLEELNIKFNDTNNKLIYEGLNEINSLTSILENLEIDCIEFLSTLARGQDYYTGNVFEVYEKNYKLTSSIGGGGRYDNMITEFIDDGNNYPAVGISFGLTGIYELLKDKIIDNNIDIYLIPINTNIYTLKLANALREFNLKVDIDMTGRKLKKSIEYADKENIKYIIIIGEDEINNESFKLKNIKTKEEYVIDVNNISEIKSIIE